MIPDGIDCCKQVGLTALALMGKKAGYRRCVGHRPRNALIPARDMLVKGLHKRWSCSVNLQWYVNVNNIGS